MPEIIEYRARGGACRLFRCEDPEVLFEGPAGTGKTRAVLEKLNYYAETYPGCRILICRATRASCTESILVTLERDVLPADHPALGSISRSHRERYLYPNGSSIVVGGLDNPERLFSTEWDLVYVAESIEITEDAWEKFARAMRSGRILKNGRPWTQRIADCNPGSPAHWLNKRALAGRMTRIKSLHTDNPTCTPEYLDNLSKLTGHRRARLYEGRWVHAEGSVFPEFDLSRHVVLPFKVPDDWPWYCGWDLGYDHPCSFLWFVIAPNETIYVADEIHASNLSIDSLAGMVKARNVNRRIRGYYADPQDAFSQRQASPETAAQQFSKLIDEPVNPWPRSLDVAGMVERVRLSLMGGRLKFFSTCIKTIEEFQTWSYKRNAKGEQLAGDDQFEDRNNHSIDVCKGMLSLGLTHTPQSVQTKNFIDEGETRITMRNYAER